MVKGFLIRHRPAAGPAVAVGVLLLVFWGGAYWAYSARGTWASAEGSVLLGFLALMFVLTTIAAVVWAGRGRSSWTSSLLGFSLVVDLCGVLFLGVGMVSGMVHFLDALCIYALLAAWGLFWTVLARLLSRWNAGAAVAISLVLAMGLFAAPVTLVPVVQVAGGETRASLLKLGNQVTPMLASLDALKSSIGPRAAAGWGEWPQMYRLSPIAQEMAILGLPRWWVTAAGFGVGAGVLGLVARVTRRRVGFTG